MVFFIKLNKNVIKEQSKTIRMKYCSSTYNHILYEAYCYIAFFKSFNDRTMNTIGHMILRGY